MSSNGAIMQKSVYDTDNDGVVNSAANVPVSGVSGLSEVLSGKIDMPAGGSAGQVLAKGTGGVMWVDQAGGGGGGSPVTGAEAVTLDPGSAATASLNGGILTIGVPRGSDGAPGTPGAAPVLSMGSVTTLPAGSSATAAMTSSGGSYTISLGIPRGSDGQGGGTGAVNWGGIQGDLTDQTDLASALDSKMDVPSNAGTSGQVLTRGSTGYSWQNAQGGGGAASASISITQDGILKGSFTLDQESDSSIALDAGYERTGLVPSADDIYADESKGGRAYLYKATSGSSPWDCSYICDGKFYFNPNHHYFKHFIQFSEKCQESTVYLTPRKDDLVDWGTASEVLSWALPENPSGGFIVTNVLASVKPDSRPYWWTKLIQALYSYGDRWFTFGPFRFEFSRNLVIQPSWKDSRLFIVHRADTPSGSAEAYVARFNNSYTSCYDQQDDGEGIYIDVDELKVPNFTLYKLVGGSIVRVNDYVNVSGHLSEATGAALEFEWNPGWRDSSGTVVTPGYGRWVLHLAEANGFAEDAGADNVNLLARGRAWEFFDAEKWSGYGDDSLGGEFESLLEGEWVWDWASAGSVSVGYYGTGAAQLASTSMVPSVINDLKLGCISPYNLFWALRRAVDNPVGFTVPLSYTPRLEMLSQANWNEIDASSPEYIRNKPAIPVVNNYTITITQGGVSKGSFTLNQATDTTIALDAGGGTGTVTWGGIQGTLADQTDLSSALNSKQDAITQATANTLDPGSAATVSIVGGVMTLGIPRGSNGQNGSTPILSMGNVATLDPGQAATATMTSAGGSYTISLGIPAGYDGDPGVPGDPGDPGSDGVTPVLSMGSVTTLDPGSSATAAMTSAGSVYTISLGIPRGSDGQGGTATGNAVQSAGLATLSSASSGMMLIYGDEASSGYVQGHIYKCTGAGGGGNSVTLTGSRSYDGADDWYHCSCSFVPYEVSGTPQYVSVYGSQYQIYSGTCYYEGEKTDPATEELMPWSGTWTWYMYPIEMSFQGESEWVVGDATDLSEWTAEATFLWAENSSVQELASTNQIAVEAGTWTNASLAVTSGGGVPTFVDITPVGTVTWGGIQGTLADQTDLTSALGSKQNVIDNSHKLDYGLLSNTPTIPTVNNPAVVISYGGMSAGSFTLNQSTSASISLGEVVNDYTHQSPKPLTHDIDLTAGFKPLAVSVSDNGTATLNSTESNEGVGYRELVISAGTSSTVSAGTSCTLADEITAGAVNYCCVRFEDGAASVYVWKVVQQ